MISARPQQMSDGAAAAAVEEPAPAPTIKTNPAQLTMPQPAVSQQPSSVPAHDGLAPAEEIRLQTLSAPDDSTFIDISRLAVCEGHVRGSFCACDCCKLGQGGQGVVFRAKKDVHRTVALKLVNQGEQEQTLVDEIKKLMALRDENVLQFYGYSSLKVGADEKVLLITEYMDRGSLCVPVDTVYRRLTSIAPSQDTCGHVCHCAGTTVCEPILKSAAGLMAVAKS